MKRILFLILLMLSITSVSFGAFGVGEFGDVQTGSGTGDITAVGDCLSGACLTSGGIIVVDDITVTTVTASSITASGTITADSFVSTGTGQSVVNEGLVVNNDGGATETHDLVVNSDTVSSAIEVDAGDDTFYINVPVKINERAAADVDLAGYGQVWVKNDAPNTLYFTDDAGTDYDLTASGSGDITQVGDCMSGACLVSGGNVTADSITVSGNATGDTITATTNMTIGGVNVCREDGTNCQEKTVTLKIVDNASSQATGDSVMCVVMPSSVNGMNLVSVGGHVYTVSSSGTPTYMIRNQTDTADMLSTALTIDANEKDSSTAATAAVINTATDDVVTGDEICVDKDTAGTGELGDEIRLGFQLP